VRLTGKANRDRSSTGEEEVLERQQKKKERRYGRLILDCICPKRKNFSIRHVEKEIYI